MQGPFVHEQKLHGCRQLTVVPCVQQVATKVAVWFHPRAQALPSAALGVGAVQRWCPPGGGLCPIGSPSIHPGALSGQLKPRVLLRCCCPALWLSPAVWPGPPMPVSDGGCASLPAEYPQGPVPTLWNEPPELPSGAGPFDTATTTARLSDATAFPPYTSELEPEDTTHLHRLDAGDGMWLCNGLPVGCSRPHCGAVL